MNGIKRFVVSASYLACVSILLRAVSVSFNAYVSTKVGAEGMGLFSLVMSVYSFAVTLACSWNQSCLNETDGKDIIFGKRRNIRSESRKLMRSCAAYSLFSERQPGRRSSSAPGSSAKSFSAMRVPCRRSKRSHSAFPQFRFRPPCADILRERAAFRAMLR